ncbi:hypothetical protein D9M71_176510 [compost metagenome]
MGRYAGRVAMLEDIAAAVHTRAFAVPHGEHAVVTRAGEQAGLLAAPDGGSGQFFVDPWLEVDVVFLEEGLGFPEALVEVAERRAAVAGDEAGGVQAVRLVPLLLQHRQAGEGLGAGEIEVTGCETVFVIQADLGQRHAGAPVVFMATSMATVGAIFHSVPGRIAAAGAWPRR